MLKFKKITIENMGPYKGRQTVDLTDGVTVIWGINGSGKTKFLNAIHFAFYDAYTNSAGEEMDCLEILNSEAYDEGHYDFGIKLVMEYDDKEYTITRQRTVRDDVDVPAKDTDYTRYSFLEIDGNVMGQEDTEHILGGIMPREIERFFLFNGELLEEYEKLLSDDARVNTEIKDAIEDILGLPILTNGSTDAHAVYEKYVNEHDKAAKEDKNTQKIARIIEDLKSTIEQNKDDLDKKQKQLAKCCEEQGKLRNELAENEDARVLLERIQNLEESIETDAKNREETLRQIVERTGDAWMGLASGRAQALLSDIDEQLTGLEKKQSSHAVNEKFIEEMKKAVNEHHCAICDQVVGEKQAGVILDKISEYENDTGGLSPEEQKTLKNLQDRKEGLSGVTEKGAFNADALEVLEKNLRNLDIEIFSQKDKLARANEELNKFGKREDLDKKNSRMQSDLGKCTAQIEILSTGIDQIKATIKEDEENLKKQRENLRKKSSGGGMEAAEKKADLCMQICEIFDQGIDAYRDKLRDDVERDATKFFVDITEDKECVALRMNDNYGLSIVHENGKLVSSRSSGYGHVVAMCLIGALHKNAPLNGPIIMDSPLGRLDAEHHDKIVRAFPKMAEQVVLLVHTKELNEQEARKLLNGGLKKEYVLIHNSTFDTQIKPNRGTK